MHSSLTLPAIRVELYQTLHLPSWYIECLKQEYAWVEPYYPRPIRTRDDRQEIGQLIKDSIEFEKYKDIPGFEWLIYRNEYQEFKLEEDLTNLD